MNEHLLKFVYDGSEKEGYALVGAQYKALVDELVDNELVEIDPDGAQPDGSFRVTVTEDGIKWVEAGQDRTQTAPGPVATPAPARPRGRPRKAQAMEVVSQGPVEIIEEQLVDELIEAEPLPFQNLTPFALPLESMRPAFIAPMEPGGSEFVARNAPAWTQPPVPAFTLPTRHMETYPAGTTVEDVMKDRVQPLSREPIAEQPVWARPPVEPFKSFEGPVDYDSIPEFAKGAIAPQPLAEAFKPIIEAQHAEPLRPRRDENGMVARREMTDLVTSGLVMTIDRSCATPSVGIITNLVPPTKQTRIKAEDRLAPWPQFGQMPVYGSFYLTEEQAADFKQTLSTANRVYGKQSPAKTFQMFDAKKVQNAGTTVGAYVFRMS